MPMHSSHTKLDFSGLHLEYAGTLWLNRTLLTYANFTLNKFQNMHAHMYVWSTVLSYKITLQNTSIA